MSLNQFAYFYGFYFYFAGNCEAGSCVYISTYDKRLKILKGPASF